MADDDEPAKPVKVESDMRKLKLEEDGFGDQRLEAIPAGGVGSLQQSAQSTPREGTSPYKRASKSSTQSPIKAQYVSPSPTEKVEQEEIIGGDITVKLEPGKAPKLSRSISQKVVAKPPQLFSDAPDKILEATTTFQVIPDCTYAAKYLGYTEHALECDCSEEWDSTTRTNHACGEDSDCINRATKMECVGDCACGTKCQNQRFQRKQYANVTVFKTEKKGYGLRTNTDLRPQDFIFEYIGEVINEAAFRRRMHQYDQEGIKHFYFMSLSKGEFVDATKKGNLGRFCNHSCNPNCYVDKWVVGDKLRMGIFAERKIKAGEELVFNYNVDRYGADPQPCYCGEPNCTGYIGGKTQTERATKLSLATIEALGIDDGEGWDTAVSKKPRKRKTGEDDEEYVNDVQPKSLDEGGVTKVMATLMQCKEKWIAVKLLGRIQRADEEKVRNRVVKMHGYQILNTALSTWIEDFNVVLQIFEILNKLPRLTRNKIQDSKIEATVQKLTTCGDEQVQAEATSLLKIWSALEVGYRIPRMKRDPNIAAPIVPAHRPERSDRRDTKRKRSKSRSRSRSRSLEAPKGPAAPTGPKGLLPPRNAAFFPGPRPAFRRPPPAFTPLPAGWFLATSNGQTYYYSASGQTTWQRPTTPAIQQPPPPPPKVLTHEQRLQEIINEITSKPVEKTPLAATPQPAAADARKETHDKKDKWKDVPEEKKRRIYENTISPIVKYVMERYKHKLPKDELKILAKKSSKKVVNGDFKHKKVRDPGRISKEHQQSIKDFVKECFERHLKDQQRRKERKKRKQAEREAKQAAEARTRESQTVSAVLPSDATVAPAALTAPEENDSEDEQSDEEPDLGYPASSATSPTATSPTADTDLKRKRTDEDVSNGVFDASDDGTPNKRAKSGETPPPPPPPPPPPADGDVPLEAVDYISEVHDEGTLADELPNSFHAERLGTEAEEGHMHLEDVNHSSTENLNGYSNHDAPSTKSKLTNGCRTPLQLATPNTVSPDDKDGYEENPTSYDQVPQDRRQQLDVGGV